MIAFCFFILFSKLGMFTGSGFLTMLSLVCLIISLVQLHNSLHAKPRSGGGTGHSGGYSDSRYPYDTSRYVYDDDGNRYDIEDGSFTEGLDGRFRGPVTKDGYVTIERDHHGDLHIV